MGVTVDSLFEIFYLGLALASLLALTYFLDKNGMFLPVRPSPTTLPTFIAAIRPVPRRSDPDTCMLDIEHTLRASSLLPCPPLNSPLLAPGTLLSISFGPVANGPALPATAGVVLSLAADSLGAHAKALAAVHSVSVVAIPETHGLHMPSFPWRGAVSALIARRRVFRKTSLQIRTPIPRPAFLQLFSRAHDARALHVPLEEAFTPLRAAHGLA